MDVSKYPGLVRRRDYPELSYSKKNVSSDISSACSLVIHPKSPMPLLPDHALRRDLFKRPESQ